jgi:hypothetical protein
MGQGFFSERQGRHIFAGFVGPVDVLVLGQSDADHMSETSFRPEVRFYNGFLSNSPMVYQEEVLDELVQHTGQRPKLILVDVRAAVFLREGDEPGEKIPKDDARFTNQWGGPWGTPPKPPPWYSDIDSMLSLQQTELSLNAMGIHPEHFFDKSEDSPKAFTIVPRSQTVDAYRLLGDGSRSYPKESSDGVLVPRGVRGEEQTEMVHPNANRLSRLRSFLRKLAPGSTVVVYSPPTKPDAYDERTMPLQQSVLGQIAQAAALEGVSYCNLSHSAKIIGCTEADFFDELHISRACDDRVLHTLADCAPRASAILRSVLRSPQPNPVLRPALGAAP